LKFQFVGAAVSKIQSQTVTTEEANACSWLLVIRFSSFI